MFWSVSLVFLLPVLFNNYLVYAESPYFVRQEITDGENDFNFLKSNDTIKRIEYNHGSVFYAEPATDLKIECKLENFALPDIKSVSFVSDGAVLNSTFWLNQAFLEPPYTKNERSPFVNDSGVDQEFFTIIVDPANNKTLDQIYEDQVKGIMRIHTIVDIESAVTDIDGNRAYNITFTGTHNGTGRPDYGNSPYKAMNIHLVNDDKLYIFRYVADIERFDKGISTIKTILNSFHITNATDSSKYYTSLIAQRNYSIYNNPSYGITIQYPSHWQKAEKLLGDSNVVTFFSPILGPYLVNTNYGVKVFVTPVYQSPESVEGYLQRVYWNSNNQTWMEYLGEKSSSLAPRAQERLIYNKPIEGIEEFFKAGEPWIHVPFWLRNINSPTQYQAHFYQDISYVKDGHYCGFSDPTYLMAAPPPKFSITSSPPSPISIGPNEEKVVEIKIHSSANLFSHAFLKVENTGTDVRDAYFMSNQIDIPPSGWATAPLVIKGSSNYFQSSHFKTLEIVAIISSGNTILISSTGNSTSANDVSPNPIRQTSDLTLNVLNSYDSILAGFSVLNTSGAVDIIIAIGGAIAGLLVGVFGKEKIVGLFRWSKDRHSGSKVSKDGKQE